MATVLHTYLAVAYPLCYFSFMSCEAAQKVVALTWLVACFFSDVSFGLASSKMPG